MAAEIILIVIIVVIFSAIGWAIYDYIKQKQRIIDERGYERDGYGRLIHRKVAWEQLYSYPKYSEKFGSYDVHHIDGNKRNNSPDNLEILTRTEHETRHCVKPNYPQKKQIGNTSSTMNSTMNSCRDFY